MTQERRKAENRSTEKLVFTDEKLIAAGLAHLEAEKAAACLVHAKGDVWVGVGTKGALRGLLSEDTASQSQAVPSELASEITTTDSARVYLTNWHLKHFPTDRTFSRYIMAQGDRSNPLAGDFAFQLAKALEAMEFRHIAAQAPAGRDAQATLWRWQWQDDYSGKGWQYTQFEPKDRLAEKVVQAFAPVEFKSHAAEQTSGGAK